MANANIHKTNLTHVAGFYYDFQMNNPLLTATLHTNTYISKVGDTVIKSGDNPYEKPGAFEWPLWKRNNENGVTDSSEDDPDSGSVYCLDPITHNYSLAYDENPSACYRAKPLIRAILNEDFQVEAGNAWSDAGGETGLEKTFNQLRAMAPLMNEIGGGVKNISEEIAKYVNPDGIVGKMNSFVGKVAKKIDEKGVDKLNSALITQGTRYSYYGGTTTTFGNLNLRFTLFADWIWDEKECDFVYKTVHEQLREIYPYVIGKYYPVQTNLGDAARHRGLNDYAEAGDKFDETVGSFFGWQQPPGGFRADVRSLDVCQKGTLRLILGGYYTAENLLISGINVNFSKTMTKIPPNIRTLIVSGGDPNYEESEWNEVDEKGNKTGNTVKKTAYSGSSDKIYEYGYSGENELTPLYADVSITLKPATSYSDSAIINFSSNLGRGKFNCDMAKMRKNALQQEIEKKREKQAQEEVLAGSSEMSEDELDAKVDELAMEDAMADENIRQYEESLKPSENQPATQYNTGETVMWTKDGDIAGNDDASYSPYPY